MRAIISAAGRAALRDGIVAFLFFATGIWAAPNYEQAAAIAVAGSIAACIAVVRAVRVFVPQLSTAISNVLHVPISYAEVVITGLTTLGIGFTVLAEDVLSAPDMNAARAAGTAGLLAIGSSLTRLVQAFFTPGEAPAIGGGISVPPQPVPASALPTPLPVDTTP